MIENGNLKFRQFSLHGLSMLNIVKSRLLAPIQQWIDGLEVHDRTVALWIYRMIPAQCPFARDIHVLGRKRVTIPPLCKLNPFYDQVVGLRFRAMCYLVDECGISLEFN